MHVYAAASSAPGSQWARDVLGAVKPYAAIGQPMGNQVALGEVKPYAAVCEGTGNPDALTEAVKPFIATAHTGNGSEHLAVVDRGYPNVLISYAYDKQQTFFEEKLGYDPPHWMGDSGAHTVWTLGETIDLDDYIRWSLHYRSIKPNFITISLDIIPGKPHAEPSKREVAKAMEESLANGDSMRAAGLSIMEVFHQGEPWSFFDTLLDRRQPGEVLGISKRGKLAPKHQIAWLDQVFARLRDRYGWDKLPPCHGLGLAATSQHAARYPWWSVDASSWQASAVYGREVLPNGKKRNDDKRNSHRELRKLYLIRTLNAWLDRERVLTQVWHDRGVRFSDTPDDVLATL